MGYLTSNLHLESETIIKELKKMAAKNSET